MWTVVPPEYLMGRIEDNENSYHRLDINCLDKDYEARLKYSCGTYFVFSCTTHYLRIKTKIHYKPITDNKKVAAEIQVLRKVTDDWEILNSYGKIQTISDQEVIFSFSLSGESGEFQICLPAQGRVDDYLLIETETEPIFKKLPLKAVLLGSSVAQDNNSSSHMNICCYTYRKLGIHIATVGISHHNTITCPEVLDKLLKLDNNIQLILMDLLNVNADDLRKFKEQFKDKPLHYLVINSKCKAIVVKLLEDNRDIDRIDISADGHYDRTHLNDYGTVLYLDELDKKKIIV